MPYLADSVKTTPGLKTPLDAGADAAAITALKLAALKSRRKMLEMGYQNHIRLHYGALMSMTDIITVLYMRWLRLRPEDPQWPDRDRFILSKGHGAPAVYVALWMRGFFDESHFTGFRRLHSILQGHPDRLKTPGLDCSSGSLGQGFPVACGMALAAKRDHSPLRVYCLIGDGECNEGSIWEAVQIASNLHLDKITVLMDRNLKSSYSWMAGRNDVEPLAEKWRAFNWAVFECDGHDFVSMTNALYAAERVEGQPAIVICRTVKGKGIPYVENYPTKPNILLTEETYWECLAHLDTLEAEIIHG